MKWLIGAALALFVLVLVLVVSVGTGLLRTPGPGPAGAHAGPVEIAMEEMRFDPNRIDARVGDTLTLRVINRGAQRHDLNFQSIHMPSLAGTEAILEPGQSMTLTLTFDQVGEHAFSCTIPGHAAAGMTGAVFVRP